MTAMAAEFHLQLLPGDGAEPQPRSRILRKGRVVVDRTDGTELEAAVEVAGGNVLFLTYDSPFDEGLHVMYLDGTDALRDEARIGFLYPGGIGLLKDVKAIGDQRIEFDFYGRWRLRVDAAGRIPLAPAPPGVTRSWRGWPRRRHLWFERLGS